MKKYFKIALTIINGILILYGSFIAYFMSHRHIWLMILSVLVLFVDLYILVKHTTKMRFMVAFVLFLCALYYSDLALTGILLMVMLNKI